MRTAWTNTKPTSITDRDESLLTIKMQTALENFAEHNWDDDDVKDQMRAELARMDFPTTADNPFTKTTDVEDASAFEENAGNGEGRMGFTVAMEKDDKFSKLSTFEEEGEIPFNSTGDEPPPLTDVQRADAALPEPFTGDVTTLTTTEVLRRNGLYYDRVAVDPASKS